MRNLHCDIHDDFLRNINEDNFRVFDPIIIRKLDSFSLRDNYAVNHSDFVIVDHGHLNALLNGDRVAVFNSDFNSKFNALQLTRYHRDKHSHVIFDLDCNHVA